MLFSPYNKPIDPYQLPRGFDPYAIRQSTHGKSSGNDRYGLRVPLDEPVYNTQRQREIKLPGDFPGERNPDYLCLIFHGRRGRGKSTGATAFARYLYDQNRATNPNYKVFANYKVNFADMCHPRLVDSLITFPEWMHDCLILIDEIAVCFPSLRATSTAALNFSTFLQEIRKLKVDMIFTTQFPTMIIGQASLQIDMFIEPFLYHKVYEPRVKAWVNDSMIMNCVDWWGQWTGYPIHHPWPPEPKDVMAAPKLHMMRNIYHQFNTNEIIPAFWHASRNEIIGRQWSEEVEAEIAEEESIKAEAASRQMEEHAQSLRRQNANYSNLGELLDAQTDKEIALRGIIEQAKRIDPKIKSHPQLAESMRRYGWSCYKTATGQWIGEKLEAE